MYFVTLKMFFIILMCFVVFFFTLLGTLHRNMRSKGLIVAGVCVLGILLCSGLSDMLASINFDIGILSVPIGHLRENHSSQDAASRIDEYLQNIRRRLNLSEALRIQNFSELMHKRKTLLNLKQNLQILPIKCFPGSEGLFPNKYDKFLLSLAEYATFHRTIPNARRLIWTCGPREGICGGLVDRLRGIALTLLLAVFSRRRLLLYWGMPNGEQIYLKPNLIDWRVPEMFEDDFVAAFQIKDTMSHENLTLAMETIGSNLTVVALATNLELEVVNKQSYRPQWLIDGMKQTGLDLLTNKEINEIFGIAFRYLFRISDDVIMKVNRAKFLFGLQKRNYVAVHIRTGFVGSLNPEEPHDKLLYSRNQWEQMLKCAVTVANNSIGLSSPIFLATDSNQVKYLATELYGSRYKTLEINLTHVDGIDKEIGPNEAEIDGLLSGWVDFFLLAQSYVHVRSGSDWVQGSGFALGASHLCGLPKSRTVDGLLGCNSEDKF